jgi:hypothetical protein
MPNHRECSTSRQGFNNEDGGTSVYIREGTTSRVMAADRPNGFIIFQRQSEIFWIPPRVGIRISLIFYDVEGRHASLTNLTEGG